MCTTFLFILSSVDWCFTFWLLKCCCFDAHIFGVPAFNFGEYIMSTPCSSLWGMAELFSTAAISFYRHAGRHKNSSFLISSPALVALYFIIVAIKFEGILDWRITPVSNYMVSCNVCVQCAVIAILVIQCGITFWFWFAFFLWRVMFIWDGKTSWYFSMFFFSECFILVC